jgi:hypothetical protein
MAAFMKNWAAMIKMMIDADCMIYVNAGAPTNGASGTFANIAGPGSQLIDYTNKILYMNTGTKAVPVWTAGAYLGVQVAKEVTLTETTGAGVYTGSVTVPAGATILDIIVNGVALWTATTSATLKVGDVADDDGYYTAVDLKATDLLAGESLSFSLAGGKAGAYIANSQVSPRYAVAARIISAICTTVGAAGNAGRTRMTVIYSLPVTADIVAATKV